MKEHSFAYELPVVSIRLVKEPGIRTDKVISSSKEAVEVVKDLISDCDRELFCVLNLRTDGSVINLNVVSMGTLDCALVSPREVFKSSLLSNAANVILFHNHPSGCATPSKEDHVITRRLADCGELLGIPVLDHIIVCAGREQRYSFAENGSLHKSGKPSKEKRVVRER